MQYINLNKTLELESKINDLLLISIDDQIDTAEDKDGIRVTGKITIGGTAKTLEGNEDFNDYIDIDIYLTYDEILERNSLNVSVNDFNYKIEDNKLYLDISLKIDGLKEIETTFLSKEADQILSQEEIDDEEKKVYIDEEINMISKDENEEDNRDCNVVEEMKINEVNDEEVNNKDNEIVINQNRELEKTSELEEFFEEKIDSNKGNEEIIITKENKIEFDDKLEGDNVIEEKKSKKSLLKSVFSNKRIKEEVSWRLHCVKDETTYEQIANKYDINLNKLIELNKNEKLCEGKLIFLPLD